MREGDTLVFCMFTVVPKKPLATPLHEPLHVTPWRRFEHMQTLGSTAPKGRRALACWGEKRGGGINGGGDRAFLSSKICSSLQKPSVIP